LHQNVVVFTCNPDTQQAKIGRIEVWGQPGQKCSLS
jgi:hypothetical protein